MSSQLDKQLLKLEQLIESAMSEATIWQEFNAALLLSLKALLDCRQTPTWLKDVDGRLIYINPAFSHFFDVEPKNILGRKSEDPWKVSPLIYSEWKKNDQKVLETQSEITFNEVSPYGDPIKVRKWPVLIHGVVMGVAAEVISGSDTVE